MRLLSLFSGIGAFEKALDRAGIKYDLVNYCEIDRYAGRAYAAVHGVSEELNLRDVQTIDCDTLKGKGVNLITYGFPCQDISIAGLMKGFEHEGQKTRSGLFYDALRVIRELQPEVAIAENVKALTGKRFEREFAAVREGLTEAGYKNYYAVLDASDYGIPQHRERVFIVSIRKDVDRDKFAFPQKEPLKLRVKDLLEYDVDEKYYIDTERARELIRKLAEEGKPPGNCSPALHTMQGGGQKQPKIIDVMNGEKDGTIRAIKAQYYKTGPSSLEKTKDRGSGGVIEQADTGCKAVGDLKVGGERGIVYDAEKSMCTLSATQYKDPHKVLNNYRIRKLTPKECWRLMGFDDEDFEKAKSAGISNTQLYKQAGNSICVPVLTAIFRQLYQR